MMNTLFLTRKESFVDDNPESKKQEKHNKIMFDTLRKRKFSAIRERDEIAIFLRSFQ